MRPLHREQGRLFPAVMFFVWGILSFSSLPAIFHFQKKHFEKTEPFFICPVPGENNLARLRSDSYGKGYFGASRNGRRVHEGIDLLAKVGEPVFAAKSGRITYAGGDNKGYGQYIEILHPNGLRTLYAHLSAVEVKPKAWIRQEELIGRTGKSGNAKNHKILPHLHFEVIDNNKPINPTPLLSYKLT